LFVFRDFTESVEKNWNGMEFFNFFHVKKIEMLFLLYD
jgi:hypothetical protein